MYAPVCPRPPRPPRRCGVPKVAPPTVPSGGGGGGGGERADDDDDDARRAARGRDNDARARVLASRPCGGCLGEGETALARSLARCRGGLRSVGRCVRALARSFVCLFGGGSVRRPLFLARSLSLSPSLSLSLGLLRRVRLSPSASALTQRARWGGGQGRKVGPRRRWRTGEDRRAGEGAAWGRWVLTNVIRRPQSEERPLTRALAARRHADVYRERGCRPRAHVNSPGGGVLSPSSPRAARAVRVRRRAPRAARCVRPACSRIRTAMLSLLANNAPHASLLTPRAGGPSRSHRPAPTAPRQNWLAARLPRPRRRRLLSELGGRAGAQISARC
eukprot:scaffold744_cov370-Prasinococcus_capsulatus_cf.AAC.17